jgi:alpha-tubulin suppressor-like RCC1 family protein
VGLNHAFAVSVEGTQVCGWGCNEHGQLGLGSRSHALQPAVLKPFAERISHVACGSHHSVFASKGVVTTMLKKCLKKMS